jgi:hypothetical protein
MHELTEIAEHSVHQCVSPRLERWHILAPVTGRWSWLAVYRCCNQVIEEDEADEELQQAA